MDPALIAQKLESLRRCVARIEARCPPSAELLATDLDAQDIAALNLTRAIQLCVDIAEHWLADHGAVEAPKTMGDAFDRLAETGKISAGLASRLRAAVGFRNIVIHRYEDVDWRIVYALCTERLGAFREFARTFLSAG